MALPTSVIVVIAAVLLLRLALQMSARYDVPERGVYFVTGASSGIGRSLALALLREGQVVFAGVRKQADAAALKRAAEAVTPHALKPEAAAATTATATATAAPAPGRLYPLLVDVTDDDAVVAAAAAVRSHAEAYNSSVSIINNAGISTRCTVEGVPIALARKLYDVNVLGVMRVVSAFGALVRGDGGRAPGRIVNVGSLAAVSTMPGHGIYSGSKRAVEGLTDAMRLEMAEFGVSVSVVRPAMVATEIQHKPGRGGENNAERDVPPGVRDAYASFWARVYERRKRSFKNAVGTDVTDAVLLHALRAPYPQTRYACAYFGKLPAIVVPPLAAVMPDRISDWLKLTVFS